jgi:hypothetical protein
MTCVASLGCDEVKLSRIESDASADFGGFAAENGHTGCRNFAGAEQGKDLLFEQSCL